MKLRNLVAAGALVFGLSSGAQAAVVFDTTVLPWGTFGDVPLDSPGFAQSFSSGPGSSLLLQQVSFVLSSDGTGSEGVLVYLAPDVGGTPGATTLLGTILDSDIVPAPLATYAEVSLSANIALAANSTYWLLLEDAPGDDSSITWALADISGGFGPSVGASGTSMFDGSEAQVVDGLGAVFQMQVDVDVPEPLTLTLFGTGLIGLGIASRLRRRKA